ncbi:MAG: response regulator [Burkholderiaceae bacterium]
MSPNKVTPSTDGSLILLVEDNPLVLATTQALLAALGYQVVTANDAGEAMAQLAEHPGIQLLVSDLGLPGNVDGRQLAAKASCLRPACRCCSPPVRH